MDVKMALNGTIPPNTTAAPSPNYLEEPTGVVIFRLIVEAVIALFGVIGNIFACVVITTRPNMKTVMNYYLLNLAVADLGILLVLFPLAILNEQRPNEYFLGKVFCLYVGTALEIFIGASIWFITVVALYRYCKVVRNSVVLAPRRGKIPKQVYGIMAMVWLLSFLLICLPLYFIQGYREGDSPSTSECYLDNEDVFAVYAVYLPIVTYVLPLIVICYTYGRILLKIRNSTKFHAKMQSESTKTSADPHHPVTVSHMNRQERKEAEHNIIMQKNKKAKQILTPLVVLFAVTMLPINVFRLMNAFWEDAYLLSYHNIIFIVSVFGFVVNSVVNPLIYVIVSQEFRTGFHHIWSTVISIAGAFSSSTKSTGVTYRGEDAQNTAL